MFSMYIDLDKALSPSDAECSSGKCGKCFDGVNEFEATSGRLDQDNRRATRDSPVYT